MKEIMKNAKIQITELEQYLDSEESWRDTEQRGIAIALWYSLLDFVEAFCQKNMN